LVRNKLFLYNFLISLKTPWNSIFPFGSIFNFLVVFFFFFGFFPGRRNNSRYKRHIFCLCPGKDIEIFTRLTAFSNSGSVSQLRKCNRFIAQFIVHFHYCPILLVIPNILALENLLPGKIKNFPFLFAWLQALIFCNQAVHSRPELATNFSCPPNLNITETVQIYIHQANNGSAIIAVSSELYSRGTLGNPSAAVLWPTPQ